MSDIDPTFNGDGLGNLTQTELESICRNLLRSGEISSDGELSDIARREIASKTTVRDMKEATKYIRSNVSKWTEAKPASPMDASGDADENPVYFVENPATCINPPGQTWLGDFNFSLAVVNGKKSKDAHFSPVLKKLFINQFRAVTVQFSFGNSLTKELLPYGLFIRATVVFLGPDHCREAVKVCYTHSRNMSTGILKNSLGEHLLRCDSPDAKYFEDPVSKRHSVVVPVVDPQPGCDTFDVPYKFMDLGSCSGGLNRRDTAMIFTLEFQDTVIGRHVLNVRICTCPKRDMEQEEKVKVSSEDRKATRPEKRKQYWVLANSRENFEALKTVGAVLESKDNGDLKEWHDAIASHNNEPTSKKRHHSGG